MVEAMAASGWLVGRLLPGFTPTWPRGCTIPTTNGLMLSVACGVCWGDDPKGSGV